MPRVFFCANGIIPEFEEVCETVDSRQDGRQQVRRRGFVDEGSMVTSTNDKIILHRLKKISFEKFLGDAGKKSSHRVEGKGFILVPGTDGRLVEIP